MITRAKQYDPRKIGAYNYSEAARIIGMPRTTLTAWKKGQDYTSKDRGRVVFEEPIGTDLDEGLSYYDLVEAFVLRSLRTEHGYRLQHIREALAIAQDEYGIERLFLHRAFRHDGGNEFFLSNLSELVTLSPSHQMAMKGVLQDYLKRIEYGPDNLSTLFRPVLKELGTSAPALLMVNANVSFGRPVIESAGIRTSVVSMRVDAGETREHILQDFGISEAELDQAIRLEAA